MARARPELAKRMQLGGLRRAEQAVPGVRADAHDAGEIGLDVAEADGAHQARQVAAKIPHSRAARGAGIDGHDQEDRGPRQRTGHQLRLGRQCGFIWRGHGINVVRAM